MASRDQKKFLGQVDTMVSAPPPSIATIPHLAANLRHILPLDVMANLLDIATALCGSSHLEIHAR